MDFNWYPQMCSGTCQFVERSGKECETCGYVTGQEIDLLSLCRHTLLPQLWEIFENVIVVSPPTKSGYNLMGVQTYLFGMDLPPVTHSEFWRTMNYFLRRLNQKFKAQMEARKG